MPKADALFLLARFQSDQSDCTGLVTSGVTCYAPTNCDIVQVDACAAVMTTTDVCTFEVYPVSAAIGAPSTRVASAMFSITSAAFGSYGADTLRQVLDPVAASTVGRHLNKGDGVNIGVTTGGTIANVKGITVHVWATSKR